MTTPDPIEQADTAARAAFNDLMLAGHPWTECLTAALHAHISALRMLRVLNTVAPAAPADPQDLEVAARWLAMRSRHPRYTEGDGWERLRQSEDEITNAYRNAAKWAAGDRGLLEDLSTTRAFLVEHLPLTREAC